MYFGRYKKFFRKGSILIASLVLVGTYALQEVNANSGGIVGQSKNGCGGYGCHGTQSTATVISISTASAQIVEGQTYVFRISVANPSERAAGCDISADNGGRLAVNGTNSGLQSAYSELTHTSPRSFTGDSAVWTFKYTAPTKVGTAHLYAAGNAVNFNGTNDAGDHWNTVVVTLNVVAPSGPQLSVPALVRDTAERGDTTLTTFYIKNVGTGALTIDHYSLKLGTSYFIADSGTHSIAQGDSAKVTVGFMPSAKITFKDTLHVYSNDEVTPVSSTGLTGVGTSGTFFIISQAVQMGQAMLGSSNTASVQFLDNGNGPMTISSSTDFAPSNPDFTLVSLSPETYVPATVAPGSILTAQFKFTPSGLGFDTARVALTISEYGGESKDTTIVLIGEGIPFSSVAPDRQQAAGVTIRPNPSRGTVALSSEAIEGPANIEISDAVGRIVFRTSVTLGGDNPLDLSSLPNGSYFLRAQTKNQSFVKNIVIER